MSQLCPFLSFNNFHTYCSVSMKSHRRVQISRALSSHNFHANWHGIQITLMVVCIQITPKLREKSASAAVLLGGYLITERDIVSFSATGDNEKRLLTRRRVIQLQYTKLQESKCH